MNSAPASDNCELTLECSLLEQEELHVLYVGPGGGGKLSSWVCLFFIFVFPGDGVIILDCHWNGLIPDVCSVDLFKLKICQQVSENS